ncbi:hypothetical protein D0U00_04295 [Leclercia adecarboxylata]|uniref:hypothetical protein n=1 Tax=Leclercia adecarboxylata TaxID=83655 RepID=UPI000E3B8B08|nr:hypothetical protein [Leclercia adecarboxylata]RFS80616.1 hypothetical protein D0U00_04295 [Leclercia adecarboxylata]
MTEYTKEQLIEEAKQAVEGCRRPLRVSPGVEAHKISLRLAEIALAALTAPTEPVYQYRIRNGYNGQVTEWQTIRRDQVDFVLKAQTHNAEFQIIAPPAPVVPDGYVLVPVEPTESMIIAGFEAELREEFRDPDAWEAYEAMSGCEQAALRAKWCWAEMVKAAPQQEAKS